MATWPLSVSLSPPRVLSRTMIIRASCNMRDFGYRCGLIYIGRLTGERRVSDTETGRTYKTRCLHGSHDTARTDVSPVFGAEPVWCTFRQTSPVILRMPREHLPQCKWITPSVFPDDPTLRLNVIVTGCNFASALLQSRRSSHDALDT